MCRGSVQMRYGWTIGLSLRCVSSDKIWMIGDPLAQTGSSLETGGATYKMIVVPTDSEALPLQFRILRWDPNGNYKPFGNTAFGIASHKARDQPAATNLAYATEKLGKTRKRACGGAGVGDAGDDDDGVMTHDDIALCIMISGEVYCLTQSELPLGTSACATYLRPAYSGVAARTQRWSFVRTADGNRSTPVCYSWEYELIGGVSRNRRLVAVCDDGDEALGGRSGFSRNGPARNGSALGTDDDADACSIIEDCKQYVLLGNVSNGGPGCHTNLPNNLFFTTPAPTQVLWACDSPVVLYTMKEALNKYTDWHIQNQGCGKMSCLFTLHPC